MIAAVPVVPDAGRPPRDASGDHQVAGQRPALPMGFVKRQRRATPGDVISPGRTAGPGNRS
ncbi:hypothetical protein EGJ24_07825 [Stenotrophomonas maltophilia]|nr:hypothetical protein [Stenotrophomonas maltophilia]RRU85267.1 hypothetical protein EGJ24_07825 [Stenotrophomonas maltophilia]